MSNPKEIEIERKKLGTLEIDRLQKLAIEELKNQKQSRRNSHANFKQVTRQRNQPKIRILN